MIGANDFFLCQETTSDSCASTAEQNATAVSVTKHIHTILSAIRNKAHHNGQQGPGQRRQAVRGQDRRRVRRAGGRVGALR
jgi:hypothetical protein